MVYKSFKLVVLTYFTMAISCTVHKDQNCCTYFNNTGNVFQNGVIAQECTKLERSVQKSEQSVRNVEQRVRNVEQRVRNMEQRVRNMEQRVRNKKQHG